MYPPWNLHSKFHQLYYMKEPISIDTGTFKTSMKSTSNSPCILHRIPIKPVSIRLHERTNKYRYRDLQNLHETYIKPPCILPWNLHQNCISWNIPHEKHIQKILIQIDVKSIVNKS